MFSILISFSYCAFAEMSPPLEDKNSTLSQIFIVLKHGHISPASHYLSGEQAGHWTCDGSDANSPRIHTANNNGFKRRYQRTLIPRFTPLRPNCEYGDLTEKGMNHIASVAKIYKEYLEKSFDYIEISDISVKTAKPDRSVRTAVSFINSFLPPAQPNENMNINIGTSNKDILSSGKSKCSDVSMSYSKFIQQQEIISHFEESHHILDSTIVKLNKTTDSTIYNLGDWMTSMSDNGYIPLNITKEEAERAISDVEYFQSKFASFSSSKAAGPVIRDLLKSIDDNLALKPNNPRIFLRVAEPEVMYALAAYFGDGTFSATPFGTSITFEVRRHEKESFIRVLANGRVVSKAIMSIADFKRAMTEAGFVTACL